MFSYLKISSSIILFLTFTFFLELTSVSAEIKDWNENFVSKHQHHRHFRSRFRKDRVKDSLFNTDLSLERSRSRDRPHLDPDLVSKTNEHLKEIRDKFSCRHPRPTLVYMKQYFEQYTLPKKYLPRCDKESGCCSSEGHECSPKKQQAVQKYFFVFHPDNRTFIEMIEFENHTECECRAINNHPRIMPHRLPSPGEEIKDPRPLLDLLPEQVVQALHSHSYVNATPSTETTTFLPSSTTISSQDRNPEQNFFLTSSTPKSLSESLESSEDFNSNLIEQQPQEQHLELTHKDREICKHVRCPKPFVPKVQAVLPIPICYCDCTNEVDIQCIRIKKGLTKFDSSEARCIRKNLCLQPRCEYGRDFIRSTGFCPKKEESQLISWELETDHHKKFERD